MDILIGAQSVLDWHHDWYLVYTRSTLDRQSVDSRPSVYWLLSINWKLVECRLTVNRDVDRVPIECCSSVDRGYQLRILIDIQPQMPLVHMIPLISVAEQTNGHSTSFIPHQTKLCLQGYLEISIIFFYNLVWHDGERWNLWEMQEFGSRNHNITEL